MATSNNNEVTHGLSGKVGDLLVFRQRHGKTLVSRVPRTTGEFTANQQAVHVKFKRASIYAKAVMANEELRERYEAKAAAGRTVYNLALADFFKAPEILDIDTNAYAGSAGNTIKVQVTDDFMVNAVEITITGSDGNQIEKGQAIQDADGLHWNYVTTMPNAALIGTKIAVAASDLPANVAIAEKVLA